MAPSAILNAREEAKVFLKCLFPSPRHEMGEAGTSVTMICFAFVYLFSTCHAQGGGFLFSPLRMLAVAGKIVTS